MLATGISLKLISPQPWKGDLTVCDLAPGRTFEGAVQVTLWPKESWYNLQYLKFFREHDLRNIKVVVHCARNFLPVASLIAHEVVMQPTRNMLKSVFRRESRISTFGFDLERQRTELSIERWDMGWHKDRQHRRFLPRTAGELAMLQDFFAPKTMYVEQKAFDWFMAHRELFPEGATDVELKCRESKRLMERLTSLGDPTLLGIDKSFQTDLIAKYNCDQFFLSLQLLAGLYNRWSFIALFGAASMFSLLLPINLLVAMDRQGNVPDGMLVVRSSINESHYRIPTMGAPRLGRRFADELVDNEEFFASTIVQGLRNRSLAIWPEVSVSEGG